MFYEFVDNRAETEGPLIKIVIRENEITNKLQITLEHCEEESFFDPLDKPLTNLHHCPEQFEYDDETQVYNEETGEYETTTIKRTSTLYEHLKDTERDWSIVVKPNDLVKGLATLKEYVLNQFKEREERLTMSISSFITSLAVEDN